MGRQKYNRDLKSINIYNAAKEHDDNHVGKKLTEIRQKHGLTLTAFSELLGGYGLSIQPRGLKKWELGESIPNTYQFLAICHALNIEDGVSFFTGSPAKAQELNDEGLKKLREYKQDLIASGRYNPQAKIHNKIRCVDMPISLLPASAGPGAFLDEQNFELQSFPESSIPVNADFGVRVSGDSMEPVYRDGQIVWIQRCSELHPGEVGLFLYDGDGYIKVYDEQEPDEMYRDSYVDTNGILHMQPVLISYNENYDPKVISPEFSFMIAGRVLN